MSDIVDSSLRKATKGATFVFTGSAASTFLWFMVKVLIARNTTTEEFGIYTLVVTITGVLSALALLGVQEGATRYISVAFGEGKVADVDSIARSSLQIGLASSIVAFPLLFLLSGLIAKHLFYKPELTLPLKVIALSVPFSIMTGIITGILRGHNIIRPRVYFEDIGNPFFFVILLGIVFVLKPLFIYIIYAYIIARMLVFVSISNYGYRKIGLKPFALTDGKQKNELLRFSLPLLISSLTTMIISWTDILMLGRYTTAEAVGIYNVSVSLAYLLFFVLNAVIFVFLPLAGEMYGRGQSSELKRTYQVLTKWVFLATMPIFFILFFFPETIINFLFGDRFVGSAMPLRILSLGLMLAVAGGSRGIIMITLGMTKAVMNLSILGSLINILLNYIFIKRLGYGVIGASAATSIAIVVGTCVTLLILYRQSGIQPFTSGYIKPIFGSAVVGAIVYAFAKNLPFYSWMLPIYFILFLCGYIFLLLVTRSLDMEDVAMFEAVSEKTGMEMKLIRKLIYRFSN